MSLPRYDDSRPGPGPGQSPALGIVPPLTIQGSPFPSWTQLGSTDFVQSPLKPVVVPRIAFVGMGIVFLVLLCLVPMLNAVRLLQDPSSMFWLGPDLPMTLLWRCAAVIALYAIAVCFCLACASGPQAKVEQHVMFIANASIVLLGMALILSSVALSRQSMDTYLGLMRGCDHSLKAHRLHEYAQVLANIRTSRHCAPLYSVEECEGFEAAPPYTDYLKALESDLHCAGFCYAAPPGPPGGGGGGSFAAAPRRRGPGASLLRARRRGQGAQGGRLAAAAAGRPGDRPGDGDEALAAPAPTLFSRASYQAPCEGLAAREVRNVAGDVGVQTFYQGIYMVVLASALASLRLVASCMRKDPAAP